MASEDYLKTVVAEISTALAPLAAALGSPTDLTAMLADLGWSLDDTAAGSLITSLHSVGTALTTLATDAAAGAELATLVGDVAGVAAALVGAAAGVAAGVPAPLDSDVFWQSLPDDLLEYLLFTYLDQHHQLAFGIFAVLGIAHLEQRPADDVTGRIAFERKGIGIDRLIAFVSSPADALRQEFGWGTAFDHRAAIWALGSLLRGLHADSDAGPAVAELLGPHFDAESEHRGDVDQLVVSLPALSSADGIAVAKAAIVALPVPPAADPTAAPEGIVVMPTFFGSVSNTFPLGDVASLTLSGTATDTPIELYLRPSGVEAVLSVAGVQAELAARVDIAPAAPLVIIGTADASRLELHKAHLRLGVTAAATGIGMEVEAVFDQLRLVVQAGEGDGFLQQVLGDKPIQVDVGPGLAWSSETGIRFAGQNSLALDIPLDVSILGVIDLDRLTLQARSAADGSGTVVIDIGVTGGLSLGPFSASVQNIGVSVRVRGTDAAHPGNLGPVDLGFGFKPPTGVGIAIDTPMVSGGGFLLIDPDAGQYAGVFELTLIGSISIKAIAIISTKMPDGSAGFALLILITAEGFTPIQLGMGFSLTGIGGLLALNRTIDVDVVRNGLRDGVLDSILFVKDPVRNAPRIISTLNKVFPLAAGRLVIGPLAEISWGSPPLVKIRLALLLEIPQPVRVVLLAQLSLVLPDEKEPVLVLHVDAVGALDFGKGELSLDASIHDSTLLRFALSGDLALRLSWGASPTFLMSVGGFHPKFPQPAGLRKLERLTLTLSDSENPKIRFETYFALTSNSIQLGARVSVYATVGGFGIDGGGSFDALIQWSPFSLEVSFEAWVRIFGPTGTLLSARLSLDVTGPSPWHLTGVAEFTILFVTARVAVDLTTGDAVTAAATETIDIAGAIWAEISKAASWQATLPADVTPGVTLADPTGVAAGATDVTAPLVIHPLAGIVGRQRVAPLDSPISRVGAHRPTAGTRSYTLQVTSAVGVRVDAATDLFAPAQYADLPDDEKLSGPSFRQMPAGAAISAQSAAAHPGVGVASSDVSLETLDLVSLDDEPIAAAAAVPVFAVVAPATAPTATAGRVKRDSGRPARLLGAQGLMLS